MATSIYPAHTAGQELPRIGTPATQQPLLRGLLVGLLFVAPFWAVVGGLIWNAMP